jgi:hypothetical protein
MPIGDEMVILYIEGWISHMAFGVYLLFAGFAALMAVAE